MRATGKHWNGGELKCPRATGSSRFVVQQSFRQKHPNASFSSLLQSVIHYKENIQLLSMKNFQYTAFKLAASISCLPHWAYPLYFIRWCLSPPPRPVQWWYLPKLLSPPPCVERMVQPVLMPSLLLASLCPSVCCYGSLCRPVCIPPPSPPRPYETPPLAASVVWSECLSVDKAERAASAAHLGWASALCRACG